LLSTTPGTPEPAAFAREDLTVTVVMGTTNVRPDTFTTIAAYLLDGTLPDPISGRYRLDDAVQAYCDLAATAHTRGKVVVSTATEPIR
jgi:NADPH:quinone reductase-like Zn-dependent oxidoreductase